MSEGNSGRSTPTILLTLSGVGLLLSIGLCGFGGPSVSGLGVAVLAISVLLFLVGIIWFIAAR